MHCRYATQSELLDVGCGDLGGCAGERGPCLANRTSPLYDQFSLSLANCDTDGNEARHFDHDNFCSIRTSSFQLLKPPFMTYQRSIASSVRPLSTGCSHARSITRSSSLLTQEINPPCDSFNICISALILSISMFCSSCRHPCS